MWRFPKIRGSFFGGSLKQGLQYFWVYIGVPSILGNYHVRLLPLVTGGGITLCMRVRDAVLVNNRAELSPTPFGRFTRELLQTHASSNPYENTHFGVDY